MKSIFPYYGGRFNQLHEIIRILNENKDKFDTIVDVFGGSAKVLINIPDEWHKVKVYNDIDKELYVTFKVLQDPRKRFELKKKLELAYPHETIFEELVRSNPRRDIDIAFKVFYIYTFSFSSAGKHFKRIYKKARVPRIRIDSLNLVKGWIIENKDFRELMDIYNKPTVLLYLDPPYLDGGKNYRYSFKLQDFIDLKEKLDNHKGTYLMNLSMHDKEMIDIFGKPNQVIEYSQPIYNTESGIRDKWGCGYWWKF